jgi:hypothetical protein
MPMPGRLESELLPHVTDVVPIFDTFSNRSSSLLPSSHTSLRICRIHLHNTRTAQLIIMEALLRQSRSMCPFLHKTSPATLRSLSTTTAAARNEVAPGAGSMSNLQVLARRCPIMGKALAVQSARNGNNALAGAFGGVRAYHTRVNRAKLHTSAPKEAQAVDIESLRGKQGTDTFRESQYVVRHSLKTLREEKKRMYADFTRCSISACAAEFNDG